MDARGPPLRPTPWRPCRRRRLGRPPCPLQELRADHVDRRRPSVVGNRQIQPVSDLPCRTSPVPNVSPAPGAQESAATRLCLLCPGARHGGCRLSISIRPLPDPRWCRQGTLHGACRLSCLDPSAAGSTAEQPRSAARSVTPRLAKTSAEANKAKKARRKAKGLVKQREDLRARLACRKQPRELAPVPAIFGDFLSVLLSNTPVPARVVFAKTKRYLTRNALKIGLRVIY